VWECGEGQTDMQTVVATIHFASATPHAKCNYKTLCTHLLYETNGGKKGRVPREAGKKRTWMIWDRSKVKGCHQVVWMK